MYANAIESGTLMLASMHDSTSTIYDSNDAFVGCNQLYPYSIIREGEHILPKTRLFMFGRSPDTVLVVNNSVTSICRRRRSNNRSCVVGLFRIWFSSLRSRTSDSGAIVGKSFFGREPIIRESTWIVISGGYIEHMFGTTTDWTFRAIADSARLARSDSARLARLARSDSARSDSARSDSARLASLARSTFTVSATYQSFFELDCPHHTEQFSYVDIVAYRIWCRFENIVSRRL